MIEIDNVSYRYEDAKRAALSDVTLNIPKGEFLAICLLYTSDAADEL